MKPSALLACVLLSSVSAGALAQSMVPATLAGQAVIPALTTVAPPADAPAGLATAGKFTATDRQRRTDLGSIPSIDFASDPKAPRPTGVDLPMKGQAVQGISAIEPIGGGAFYLLTDNGFGSRVNSVDAMLMVHRIEPDFASGAPNLKETLFLHDPDRKVPFHIVNENTEKRYLTGADFDPESLRIVGDELWIGDEFGPYLVRLTKQGRVLAVHETKVGDTLIRSPDHYTMSLPPSPAEVPFQVRRSGGFEPMGRSPDGRFLYPGFEKPLWDAARKGSETMGDKTVTRILEFSVAEARYTGRWWAYELSDPTHVVADMTMVDATSAILIERDDVSEGAKEQACQGEARAGCFNRPAAFKRVVKVVFGETGQPVKKAAQIDLTDMADPDRKARLGRREDGRFGLPHLGPEGLALVDAEHIVVVNDNNFPYSMGRTLGRPDDNEITLIRAPELIAAR